MFFTEETNIPDILFLKRAIVCFTLCIVLFFVSVLKVASITFANFNDPLPDSKKNVITLGKTRGTVYDCNKVPLTNSEYIIMAVILPTQRALTAVKHYVSDDEYQRLLKEFPNGKPMLCRLKSEVKCDGVSTVKMFVNSNEPLSAPHFIGYTDADGKGISGIEYAYDSLLYCENDVSVSYEINGKGKIINGIDPEINNGSFSAANGVITTLDINIQKIAEKAANNLQCGAVVIAECDSGKLRAIVSRPGFDSRNIADYLKLEDSPLLDRTLHAYNVGSVFKPCVAAAGMENGLSDYKYNCEGSCEIGNRIFKCHAKAGHGLMDLKNGLANSCNTFFYNFAYNAKGENVLKTAMKLNFGRSFEICSGISVSGGKLPQKSDLSDMGTTANFSIGQGELLLSPIGMLTLYSAIASDGCYYIPSGVEGVLKNGKYSEYNKGFKTRAMQPETAEILREYLKAVITDGTGKDAAPKTVSAAGKTATAQTGKFRGKTEICQGWFCGFFPAEKPKYTVIVFSEDNSRQNMSCSKIFSLIADEITALENDIS